MGATVFACANLKAAFDGGYVLIWWPEMRRAMNGVWNLAQMLRDELGHLEHTHLALTIEYRPE